MSELIVMAAIVFGGLLLWLFMHRERPVRFRRKSVLIGGERDFFFCLRQALPTCIVCPQVAVSALIEPAGSGPARRQALMRIAGERVGYAILDEEMRLIAVVELDRRSRIKRRDAAREAYFASAGIKTVRFQAKHLPSATQIQASILPLVPACQRERSAVRTVNFRARRHHSPWRNTTKIRI